MSNLIDIGNRISCSLNVEENKNIHHTIKAKRKIETAKNIFTIWLLFFKMLNTLP